MGNRLMRVVWMATYALLFRWTPRPLHFWRRFLLRLFGAKIGKGCRISPYVNVWAPWNIECGNETVVAGGVIFYSQDKIIIGNRCVISQGSHFCTGSHDYTSPTMDLWTKPIIVKDDAWIATDSFLHPGVTIGTSAVIGARSVVTKDMPDGYVCVGHPCRPIKRRHTKG
jgi:putative colanic acid biosynthesis acetyltransferase WcaF